MFADGVWYKRRAEASESAVWEYLEQAMKSASSFDPDQLPSQNRFYASTKTIFRVDSLARLFE